MPDEDPDQSPVALERILRQLGPWGIKNTNVHTGTSKRVYVKGKTKPIPQESAAYLTSRFQIMENPGTLEKEYKYTRYLDEIFPGLLVSESPINPDNKPLTNILNSKRGLFISKKEIVQTPKPGNAHPSDTEGLLKFMMASTDFLIENGFANLDSKPQNIGIITIVESHNELRQELRINDNGANMFYPIPSKYKEHYRDAIKLVTLFNLSSFGLDKTMFDANQELYPNINYKRALDLCVKFKEEEEDEIREYAKTQMSNVHVDGKDEDLSSLFDDILFPGQLVTWYGGKYNRDDFIGKLRTMGLISDEEREQNERRAERQRQDNLKRNRNRNNTTSKLQKSPAKKTTKSLKASPTGSGNRSGNRRANGSGNRRANGSARR